MGIKESIANLRKALRTTQTNAPAVIDTLIRGLDGVETAAEDERTYSTDERIVGTWIDGSEIYEKTIDCGALPNTTSKSVNHGIENLDRIISIDGISKDNNLNNIMFPHINTVGAASTSLYVTSTTIVIRSFSDMSTYNSTYVTLRYIKATTNRSPENDTKNDGDEEKKDDER